MSQLRVRRAPKRGRAVRAVVLALSLLPLLLLAGGCGSGDQATRSLPAGITLPEVGTLGREPHGPGTIVVDVDADGHIAVDGEGPLSLLGLRDTLARRTKDPAWREPDGSSLEILLLRADRNLPWTVAQWVMQTAAEPTVRLYRVFFGARSGAGALGAIGCALPKDNRWGDVWVEPPPRVVARVVPRDGRASAPEDLLGPLRAAAGDRPLHEVSLDLQAVTTKDRQVPTGFMVRLVDVALRAGVRNIVFEGAPMSRAFEPDDVEGLLDHVATLRARLGAPVLKVNREVVPPLPSHEAVPPAQGRLAHLYGFGVEEEERGPDDGEADETSEEAPLLEEPVIEDEEIETDGDLPYEESLAEEGLVDAPFVGPPAVYPTPKSAFPSRARDGEREDAVEAALRWLLAHQSPNGGWAAADFGRWCHGKEALEADRPHGAGQAVHDVGTTGLALCAFLGAGYTNRGKHPYAKAVSKGLRYLKNVQDAEGCFGPRTHLGWIYDHAAATLAMVEAHGMTHSPIFKPSARKALEFTLRCRNPGGAWGYGLQTGEDRLDPTAWMLLPLLVAQWIDDEAAHREKRPPFGLAASPAFDDTYAWLVRSEAVQPSAVLLRLLLGEDPQESDVLRVAAAGLARQVPRWDHEETTTPERLYFTTLALHQVGGASWHAWNTALRNLLRTVQGNDGEPCRYEGSWGASGAWAAARGRVAATALAAMCLEAPYRYERVFRLR